MREAACYNNWYDDLCQTKTAQDVLIDHLAQKGGRFYNIENSDNDMLQMLDKYSGIDMVREHKNNQLSGVALRIQYGQNYRTFTIRKKRWTGTKTEYEKRVEAIQNGYFYPRETIQAYFTTRNNPELIGFAYVLTKDLYQFIDEYPDRVYTNFSDNEFYYVRWDDLRTAGVKIYIDECNEICN